MAGSAHDVVVATLNVHAGVDEWGRPFDVTQACRSLDADVIVLQEAWAPTEGVGIAEAAAQALGYRAFVQTMAPARRADPDPSATEHWAPPHVWLKSSRTLMLEGLPAQPASVTESARFKEATPGKLGVAVLTRLPVVDHHVIDLGRLPRDRAHRFAVVVRHDVAGTPLTVAGTHMSHLTQGSLVQFRRLRRALDDYRAHHSGAMVLAGDMNLWGPPVGLVFGGWRRTVRQATWPAWRPHSQLDHILVAGPVALVDGRVEVPAGSDHLGVRAQLHLS